MIESSFFSRSLLGVSQRRQKRKGGKKKKELLRGEKGGGEKGGKKRRDHVASPTRCGLERPVKPAAGSFLGEEKEKEKKKTFR